MRFFKISVLPLIAALSLTAATTSPETAYLAIPSADGARETSQVLDSVPHYAGTPGDYRIAVYMRDRMRAFGLQARLESFSAVVYTPKTLELALLKSPVVHFDLHDPKIPGDSASTRPGIGLPFNTGSGSGDVTAPVVDAGHGVDADYARLQARGLSVRGKIALIRYGMEYRGNLALRAQQHGAVGVLFFTDTADNKGPAYPQGPYPSDATIQRGDVMGDDNRPLNIPVMPISGSNARVLVNDMRNGVTTSNAHFHVVMNANHTMLWNSIGEIPGTHASQSIIMGGHRDAWVFGVSDDGSGISTLLEVARGLGQLHRNGWTPNRTIIIAGWDAEEIGSLGATAYVTQHRAAVDNGCIAYINTDEAASGPQFGISAAGALADAVSSPIQSALGMADPHIDPPSGGSDFDSFIYVTGTPIIDTGYSGPLGTYHSPYDNLQYTERFADPGFVRHRAIARLLGVLAMQLAASPRPLRFAPYTATFNAGVSALTKSAAKSHLAIATGDLQRAIDAFDVQARHADASTSPQNIPQALAAVRQINLLAYASNGYASVAFPAITSAIATGNQAAVDGATQKTVAQLTAITRSL
jgi:N-acetylated-alpha-linked acidic dipeptidase